MMRSEAYLGLYFGGGGGQAIFGRVGQLHAACLLGGRGHAPPRNKNLKNGAFWSIVCSKNLKNINFLNKIMDIVLLCTIFRGIGTYSSENVY